MLFSQSIKKDMWVASVDLTKNPREYGTPILYKANVLPTSDGSDVSTFGSRLSNIERAVMPKRYGAGIKHYDRVWVMDKGSTAPETDVLARTATHVVRGIKDTPLVRMIEVSRLTSLAST